MRYLSFVAPLALVLVTACSSSSNGGGNPGDGGPTGTGSSDGRKAVACADVKSEFSSVGTFNEGSWGFVPSALRSTPSDGSLCGTLVSGDGSIGADDITVVVTDLHGQALSDFYKPLLTSIGCALDATASSGGGYGFSCTNGSTGTLSPNPSQAFLQITYTGGASHA